MNEKITFAEMGENYPDLVKYSEKAEGVLNDDMIDIRDFEDLYGEEVIARDEKYVATMEKRFEEEDDNKSRKLEKVAKILEAIIYEQVELSNWFSNNAFTIKTSKYDDIMNGVDCVVEFINEDDGSLKTASHMALAIDATFNQFLGKKFRRIKDEIERGELSKIKYFQSDNIDFRGELRMVPRAIIGAEPKIVFELAKIWMDKSRKKELANHPVLLQVLAELRVQLKCFYEYANKVGQRKAAEKYLHMYNSVEVVIKSKGLGDFSDGDHVYEAIKEYSENIEKI